MIEIDASSTYNSSATTTSAEREELRRLEDEHGQLTQEREEVLRLILSDGRPDEPDGPSQQGANAPPQQGSRWLVAAGGVAAVPLF